MQPRRVEPAFGRALLAPFGHDAGGMRFVAQRYLQHLLGCRHFQIKWQAGRGLNAGKVAVADMSSVFAQMRRNTVATNTRDNLRSTHWIRMVAAARITDSRDMIDIDAKAKVACHLQAFRLPGLTASVAASSGGSSSGA